MAQRARSPYFLRDPHPSLERRAEANRPAFYAKCVEEFQKLAGDGRLRCGLCNVTFKRMRRTVGTARSAAERVIRHCAVEHNLGKPTCVFKVYLSTLLLLNFPILILFF